MTTFLLIRHATNDHVGKTICGRMAGVHLNQQGQQQANALAGRLRHLPLAAIYSSPLERAIETAEPIAKAMQLQVKPDGSFLELDFGQWTGKSINE